MKKLLLTACVALLTAATADAFPRRLMARRACVSPAPVRMTAPQYDTIPRPLVPVPTIPPQGFAPVVMPAVGVLTMPARVVQTVGGCVGGVCPIR